MPILTNEKFKLEIKQLGAELCSFFSKDLNKELLWQADKDVWARHAPVLFPIVGKLKNNTYSFKGKIYSLPQHGFARDCEFQLTTQNKNSLVFELKETEGSLKNYPFRFNLKINYELTSNGFSCKYMVTNPATEPLYFSIGAHPGFNCPLFENESFEDYCLEFKKDENIERYLIQDGLISDHREKIQLKSGKLALSSALFERDAIVLKQINSSSIKLSSNSYCLNFSWFNMPYYGIWTKPGTRRFICLEPWAGIADSVNASGNLIEKEGIICLKEKEQYKCGFTVDIHPQ